MKKYALTLMAIVSLSFAVAACSSTIPLEKYVDVMSDLGCQGVTELDTKAKDIFAKHAVTQKDIDNFRRNLKREQIKDMADQIVGKVAACHGVDLKSLGLKTDHKDAS